MTTIRRLCCNDLLEMSHIQMTLLAQNNNFKTLSAQLEDILEYPSYCLVALTPGNRINGYSASRIIVKDKEKYCKITDLKYLTQNMGEMIMKAIEERADKIHKVFYMRIRLISMYHGFFGKLGFNVCYEGGICFRESPDCFLIKEFPQNIYAAEAEAKAAAALELQIFRRLLRFTKLM